MTVIVLIVILLVAGATIPLHSAWRASRMKRPVKLEVDGTIDEMDRLMQRLVPVESMIRYQPGKEILIAGTLNTTPIVGRTVFEEPGADGVQIIVGNAPQGQEMYRHLHIAADDKDELASEILIVYGQGKMIVRVEDEEERTIQRGQSCEIRPGMQHAAIWPENTKFVAITIPRAEYRSSESEPG